LIIPTCTLRHGFFPAGGGAATLSAADGVVLDYCAAVRGIKSDDQGGPLQPPGLRMAEGLQEVQASLQLALTIVLRTRGESASPRGAGGGPWTKAARGRMLLVTRPTTAATTEPP